MDTKKIALAGGAVLICLLILSSVSASAGGGYYYYNKKDPVNDSVKDPVKTIYDDQHVSPLLNSTPVLTLNKKYYVSTKELADLFVPKYLYTADEQPVLLKINNNTYYLVLYNQVSGELVLYNLGTNKPDANKSTPPLWPVSLPLVSYSFLIDNNTDRITLKNIKSFDYNGNSIRISSGPDDKQNITNQIKAL
jgi:hypothetical protein